LFLLPDLWLTEMESPTSNVRPWGSESPCARQLGRLARPNRIRSAGGLLREDTKGGYERLKEKVKG